jgi:hypothetical protein
MRNSSSGEKAGFVGPAGLQARTRRALVFGTVLRTAV